MKGPMSMSNVDRSCELLRPSACRNVKTCKITSLFACRIERNRAKLTALGIPLTASALHSSAKTKTK